MNQLSSLLTGVLMLFCAATVHSKQLTFYGGVNFGLSRLTPNTNDSGFRLVDKNSTAYGGFLGLDVTTRISLELGGSRLGSALLSGNESIGYNALSAGALFYLLGDRTAIAERRGLTGFVRLGANKIDNTHDIRLRKANNTAIWAGIGIEWSLTNKLSLRGELTSFDGDAQAGLISLLYRQRRPQTGNGKTARVQERIAQQVPTDRSTSTPGVAAEQPAIVSTIPVPVIPVPTAPSVNADSKSARDCQHSSANEPLDPYGCGLFSGVVQGVDFYPGTADLTPIAQKVLDRLAISLRQHPGLVVEIAAHTEAFRGSAMAKQVARKRAVAVARYLAGRNVAVGRLRARAFGSSRPRADNATSGGRRLNNRISLRVIP